MKNLLFVSFYLLINYNFLICDFQPEQNIGKIWPKPKFEERCKNKWLDPGNFTFEVIGQNCDILIEALLRYTQIIKLSIISSIIGSNVQLSESNIITKIFVNLTKPCELYPHLQMDESYHILEGVYIYADSIWAILRALETYSQSIVPTSNGILKVPNFNVTDSPRFAHRGLMVDTARHYISVDKILTILDGMSYNKLNVFHWHIVDDQSFPYQSVNYPELSEKGAYMSSMVYTQENITYIIEYARMRGIRVIPEFDVPAHTRSWGNSHPEILTSCEWFLMGKLGPLNPLNENAYILLQKLFSEVINLFPDKFVHIGGNDIGFECWESNENISSYVTSYFLTYELLYENFMKNITKSLINKLRLPIVWQEATMYYHQLPIKTIVQVQLRDWQERFHNLTTLGYHVLLSECWSLNSFSTNNEIGSTRVGAEWKNDYKCEPYDFSENDEHTKFVIGGEAFIWSHYVGNHNILQRIFPRICAMAERLWSVKNTTNITDATQRLEEHICRMRLRGIPAESPSSLVLCI